MDPCWGPWCMLARSPRWHTVMSWQKSALWVALLLPQDWGSLSCPPPTLLAHTTPFGSSTFLRGVPHVLLLLPTSEPTRQKGNPFFALCL